MTETEFIEAIDCRLPYGDVQAVQRIIERAQGISSNAAFMALHEICRPPRSKKLSLEQHLLLLRIWAQAVDHPLCAQILPIAETVLRGADVPVPVAMAAMQAVAQYPNEYNALAIAYFSCDDKNGEADALHQRITRAWIGA